MLEKARLPLPAGRRFPPRGVGETGKRGAGRAGGGGGWFVVRPGRAGPRLARKVRARALEKSYIASPSAIVLVVRRAAVGVRAAGRLAHVALDRPSDDARARARRRRADRRPWRLVRDRAHGPARAQPQLDRRALEDLAVRRARGLLHQVAVDRAQELARRAAAAAGRGAPRAAARAAARRRPRARPRARDRVEVHAHALRRAPAAAAALRVGVRVVARAEAAGAAAAASRTGRQVAEQPEPLSARARARAAAPSSPPPASPSSSSSSPPPPPFAAAAAAGEPPRGRALRLGARARDVVVVVVVVVGSSPLLARATARGASLRSRRRRSPWSTDMTIE